MYDYLTFIGRFQPVHIGHLEVIRTALQKANKLIIQIGSSNSPRSLRNPFSYQERKLMIESTLTSEEKERIIFTSLNDHTYNDNQWVEDVQRNVYEYTDYQSKIGLIGCNKDHSSYYLKLFPSWGSVNVDYVNPVNATDIREQLFNRQSIDNVPDNVTRYIESPEMFGSSYLKLFDEYQFVKMYKQQWADSPYPPTFVTVDAVVVQSGNILVVERKAQPGKGMLALPGGFLGQSETILDATIRELREETKLKVPAPVLKGSLKKTMTFDDPHRSSRGRTITHAHYFKLNDDTSLPRVKGSDDAAHAFWMPLCKLDDNSMNFFEDHYHIIKKMVEV